MRPGCGHWSRVRVERQTAESCRSIWTQLPHRQRTRPMDRHESRLQKLERKRNPPQRGLPLDSARWRTRCRQNAKRIWQQRNESSSTGTSRAMEWSGGESGLPKIRPTKVAVAREMVIFSTYCSNFERPAPISSRWAQAAPVPSPPLLSVPQNLRRTNDTDRDIAQAQLADAPTLASVSHPKREKPS